MHPQKSRLIINEGTIDMMNNLNDIYNIYQQMRSDPRQFLSRRFNIPKNVNDPNDIIQHLLNSGQVTQSQVNNAMMMRNNPIVQRLLTRH